MDSGSGGVASAPEKPPRTREAVASWVRENVGVELAAEQLGYLSWAFLEGDEGRAGSPRPGAVTDSVVWACRGGGKTFVAALATAMDLIFKAGIRVRLVAGSLEQGERMYEHLRAVLESERLGGRVEATIGPRQVTLANGSSARLLAPTHESVRGVRVHKLRIDEVELMDPDLWQAAQLTTKSEELNGYRVRGSVECFSTMHEPGGMMARLVEECGEGKRRLFKWGLMDVVEGCGARQRTDAGVVHLPQAAACALLPECGGPAVCAGRRAGHVRFADAVAMKARVDRETWEAEMLCLRPRRTGLVLGAFSAARHVYDDAGAAAPDTAGSLLCGMDFGLRSPSVVLWARLDAAGVLRVVDERIVKDEVLERHVDAILSSPWGRPAWIGIDPAGANRNDQTGVSSAAVMKKAGLDVRWQRRGVQEGLAMLRARLSPADGSPARVLVHARCRGLIKSIETYRYDLSRPQSLEPLKDGPDHAVDALRYLVVCLDGAWEGKTGKYA